MKEPDKILIISPVRNEAAHIARTLDSVINQTWLPAEWVIVDDGSTDNTAGIVQAYADKHPWIHFLHKEDRGYAEPGRGVMEAFYFGYDRRRIQEFDVIVKLDGDLSFPSDFFASIMTGFEANPKLGIAGGYCYIERDNKIVREDHPVFHVRGTNKFYRAECWREINGLVRHLGWDTIDEIKAQYYGWQTLSFDSRPVMHYKVTGYNTGAYKWTIKLGQADYYVGYHPLFLLAKALKRSVQYPYFIGTFGILYGYFRAWKNREKRVMEKDIIRFLRREQIKTLFLKPSLWNR
jgi:biofilm PGA synthesis N-glycosyltransferase PgaC